MHAVHVFVIRVLVDGGESQTLRGTLRLLPDGTDLPFTGEAGLLNTLRQAAFNGHEQALPVETDDAGQVSG